jgi:hypothetical protein
MTDRSYLYSASSGLLDTEEGTDGLFQKFGNYQCKKVKQFQDNRHMKVAR